MRPAPISPLFAPSRHAGLGCIDQQVRACIRLRHTFVGNSRDQVPVIRLDVVRQPIDALHFVEEVAIGHDAVLNDGAAVDVFDEDVAVLGFERGCLILRQGLGNLARLGLAEQRQNGILPLEVNREAAPEQRRDGIYLSRLEY